MRVALAGLVLLGLAATGCESEEEKAAEHALENAADRTTCLADASPAATPYPDGAPTDWPWPPSTVVYHAEDRGSDGIILTATTGTPFDDVLAFLNGPVSTAGYVVTSAETEEHDAEAGWSGNGFRGRWAIRESATCPGETVIQVLSTPNRH
ncbi:MAG TPA: hypothetical protein VEK80_13250 [Kribbellaceae bacterium]|nr:hypothetical protein [Kribbellaceae bacterium]